MRRIKSVTVLLCALTGARLPAASAANAKRAAALEKNRFIVFLTRERGGQFRPYAFILLLGQAVAQEPERFIPADFSKRPSGVSSHHGVRIFS